MELLLLLPVLIFSVIFHEVSHGIVAHRFGDDTAYHSGRITLNPLPHLDPIGSVIFPALCIFMHMPVFGWARPVPINPNRFTSYRSGVIWVAVAGPATNLLLAVIATVILSFSLSGPLAAGSLAFLPKVLSQAILINLVLAVFNLIPIPPLDGSRVVSMLLPTDLARRYDSLEPYGFFIVMGLIAFGVLGKILYPAVGFLYMLLIRSTGL